jgi:hypothetical protein
MASIPRDDEHNVFEGALPGDIRLIGVDDLTGQYAGVVQDIAAADGRHRLKGPITIQVSDADRDGIFVVTDSISTIYGAGESPRDAVRDYVGNLFDYFVELEEDESALGPGLQRELEALRRHIDVS